MRKAMTLLAVGGLAVSVHGAWDESADGDLSTDPAAPTPVAFSLGSNVVSGSVMSPDDTRDYFTFSIGPGEALTGIFLLAYSDGAGGEGNRGFMHIDDGTSSVVPSGSTITDFLGGSHLDRTVFPTAADNVLTVLAGAPEGGVGFVAPLGPGDYTINVQQTSDLLSAYSLDFVVVPAPAGVVLFGGIGLIAGRRRR